MKQVIVNTFGGPERLELTERGTPDPGPGEVRVRLTSIGMNHAELMARRGEYKIASGDPPFTPGLEGGGVIDAVGDGVTERSEGQRVVLGLDVPREGSGQTPGLNGAEGTYRSHYICPAEQTVPAPDVLRDEQLGAVWLPYLTAWGCLERRHQLSTKPGSVVALPAASSSVALAASQIAKVLDPQGTVIGLTTSPEKVKALQALPDARFDHVVVTREGDSDKAWHRDIKEITDGKGVDLFFDPVAAGAYLNTEIRCLARGGVVWVYGLLGEPGGVDVSPLIRLQGSIRGWVLTELATEGGDALQSGYNAVLDGFARGDFVQTIGGTYRLDDVQRAHREMEQGDHVGKLVLVP